MKHSPLPWGVWGDHKTLISGPDGKCMIGEMYVTRFPHPEAKCRELEEAQANAAHAVHCVNQHDALVDALTGLAYWSERINSLQHAGLKILPSSWSELFDATNKANALLVKEID